VNYFYLFIKYKYQRHMYKVKTDPEKNRLLLTLTGLVTMEEALAIKEVIAKEVPKLTAGFEVINDISNFRLAQEQAGRILKEIINYCIAKKVGQVIRVVGASQSALIQFANFTGNIESYNVRYVPTLRDAEAVLEKEMAH
jgi:hypothetical protein